MTRKLPELLCLLALILELGTAAAQQTSQPEQNPIPASNPQESAGPPDGGALARQMANANNPLADMNALQFQNYFTPTFYGVSNVTSNVMNLRGVLVSGRMIFRATLPISTVPAGGRVVDVPEEGDIPELPPFVGSVQYASGLGDLIAFLTIRLTASDAATAFAIGPMVVAPTATDKALGNGKWQAGAAGVVIHPLQGGNLLGALITWQHSFAGQQDRPSTNVSIVQPLGIFQIGGGYYVRSSSVILLDLQNGRYLVPFGIGVGRVFRVGKAITNVWVEPQPTIYHNKPGLPAFQLFMGINFQWAKRAKK